MRHSRRFSYWSLSASAVVLLAMNAGCASGTHAADPAVDGVALPNNHVVCRKELPTGSKIPRRVCKTQSMIAS